MKLNFRILSAAIVSLLQFAWGIPTVEQIGNYMARLQEQKAQLGQELALQKSALQEHLRKVQEQVTEVQEQFFESEEFEEMVRQKADEEFSAKMKPFSELLQKKWGTCVLSELSDEMAEMVPASAEKIDEKLEQTLREECQEEVGKKLQIAKVGVTVTFQTIKGTLSGKIQRIVDTKKQKYVELVDGQGRKQIINFIDLTEESLALLDKEKFDKMFRSEVNKLLAERIKKQRAELFIARGWAPDITIASVGQAPWVSIFLLREKLLDQLRETDRRTFLKKWLREKYKITFGRFENDDVWMDRDAQPLLGNYKKLSARIMAINGELQTCNQGLQARQWLDMFDADPHNQNAKVVRKVTDKNGFEHTEEKRPPEYERRLAFLMSNPVMRKIESLALQGRL